ATGLAVALPAQAVTELIGHQLGIDGRLPTQTGMRAPHDLKGRPVESGRVLTSARSAAATCCPAPRALWTVRTERPRHRDRRKPVGAIAGSRRGSWRITRRCVAIVRSWVDPADRDRVAERRRCDPGRHASTAAPGFHRGACRTIKPTAR